MKYYDNSRVRRQDRLLDPDTAEALLMNGEFAVLSMVNEDNTAYGIPVNYVFDGNYIYLHCAPEGQKLRAIAQQNQVSICVIGKTNVISHQFTTEYQSVIVKGCASLVHDDKIRWHALELILDKYSPHDKEIGMKYAAKSFQRTAIIQIEIESVSGKAKAVKQV